MQMDNEVSHVKRRMLTSLTGLRFLGALWVYLFHFGSTFAIGHPSLHVVGVFLSHGYLGVSLFFVMSGFVLIYTYEGRETRKGWIAEFFVARFARLYPVYLLALLIAAPFLPLASSPGQLTATLLLVQSWGLPSSGLGYFWISQGWALSVEFTFYLVFPMLLGPISRLSPKSLWWCIGICSLIMFVFAAPTIGPLTTSYPFEFLGYVPLPVLRMFEFAQGLLLGRLFLQLRGRFEGRTLGLATGIVCLAILILTATTNNAHLLTATVILMSVLIVLLAFGNNALTHLLSQPALQLLGESAYALYILQGPVRMVVGQFGDKILVAVVNPLVAFPLAVIVYLVIEKKCRVGILSLARRSRR